MSELDYVVDDWHGFVSIFDPDGIDDGRWIEAKREICVEVPAERGTEEPKVPDIRGGERYV